VTRAIDDVLDSVEAAEGLDRLAAPAAAFWSKVLRPGAVRHVLSGTPIGHPLHPAIVLLPAGALLSATVCDAARQEDAAQLLTAVGVASSVPAILAGWSDWLDTEQAEKRVGLVHATSNAVGVTAHLLAWAQRRSGRRGLGASVAGSLALGLGGWLGGHLAYAQGVGVDTTAFDSGPTEWTDIAASDDVTTALTQVDVGGFPLLVTRVAGKAVAIADRCTHRGGPLSDGERVGDCVVCPWHDSEFELSDGTVRRGPATRPQPVLDVRVEAGRVHVRRSDEPRTLRTNPIGR
jgi:nitrite reductase/ring-hydroxylating ferredoxin subunit/uncharacterized membrane protein